MISPMITSIPITLDYKGVVMGKLILVILALMAVVLILPGMFPVLANVMFTLGTVGITGTMLVGAAVVYLSLAK